MKLLYFLSGFLLLFSILYYFRSSSPQTFSQAVLTPAPFPRGCPGDPIHDDKPEWTQIAEDLAECKSGDRISIHYGSVMKPVVWRVEVIGATEEPIVQVSREDGVSYVKKIGPNLYECLGEVVYVYKGTGKVLNLSLVKK
jgi:hypothetical protein